MSSTLPKSTRVSLIKRARRSTGESDWEELITLYEPFIRKILVHLGLRDHDLDDLLQEINVKLWKGLDSYRLEDPETRFRSWLSRLIRNAVANHFRSAARRPSLDQMTEVVEALHLPPPEIDEIIAKEWESYIVNLALTRLSKVFTGNAIEVTRLSLLGTPLQEISECLKLTEESIYVLRHRVKRRLILEIADIRKELEGND